MFRSGDGNAIGDGLLLLSITRVLFNSGSLGGCEGLLLLLLDDNECDGDDGGGGGGDDPDEGVSSNAGNGEDTCNNDRNGFV